jgi:hypothetical protein
MAVQQQKQERKLELAVDEQPFPFSFPPSSLNIGQPGSCT